MIILDFDGVIIDSVNEMACTAFHTISGTLTSNLESLPANYVSLFRSNRFHVQPAGDLLPFARWCFYFAPKQGDYILSDQEYRDLLEAEKTPGDTRRESFFNSRAKLIAEDKNAWLALNTPYFPLAATLKSLSSEEIIILTNKNRSAVLEITAHYLLPVVDENIYSGDGGTTKLENLKSIEKRFGRESYIFIDDSVKNLRELRHSVPDTERLQLWLADWGYVGPCDKMAALKLGFKVVRQDEVARALSIKFL